MHRIGYVLADGFQVMALAAQAAFEYANFVTKDDFYAVENYSEPGGEVRSSLGLLVGTPALGLCAGAAQTLPGHPGRRRPHLRDRWTGLDLRWHDGRDGSRAGDGGEGPGRRRGAFGRAQAGDAPAAFGRADAALRDAGALA